jgi:ATP-dependent helicase HrpA
MGGDLKKPFGFMKHNQRLIDDIQADEDRLRRRDILISDADMRAFYQQHLKHIYSLATLSKYLKKRGPVKILNMLTISRRAKMMTALPLKCRFR